MLHEISYMVLDAARMGGKMNTAKVLNPVHDSLYRGGSEEKLACVAPYLFSFTNSGKFNDWYLDNGWGDAWGMLIKSPYPMSELHKHFRKFLIVGTEDKQQLYFRFYDPRVLRIFLPTCDVEQLVEFFGPIEYFLMEDDAPDTAIKCWLHNRQLKSEKISMSTMLGRYRHVAQVVDPAPSKSVQSEDMATEQHKKRTFFQTQETISKPTAPTIPQPVNPLPQPVVPGSASFAANEVQKLAAGQSMVDVAKDIAPTVGPSAPAMPPTPVTPGVPGGLPLAGGGRSFFGSGNPTPPPVPPAMPPNSPPVVPGVPSNDAPSFPKRRSFFGQDALKTPEPPAPSAGSAQPALPSNNFGGQSDAGNIVQNEANPTVRKRSFFGGSSSNGSQPSPQPDPGSTSPENNAPTTSEPTENKEPLLKRRAAALQDKKEEDAQKEAVDPPANDTPERAEKPRRKFFFD